MKVLSKCIEKLTCLEKYAKARQSTEFVTANLITVWYRGSDNIINKSKYVVRFNNDLSMCHLVQCHDWKSFVIFLTVVTLYRWFTNILFGFFLVLIWYIFLDTVGRISSSTEQLSFMLFNFRWISITKRKTDKTHFCLFFKFHLWGRMRCSRT